MHHAMHLHPLTVTQVDMIAEMRHPKQFRKSIWLSQSFMCANYSIVGFLGYYAYGNGVKSPITLNLPDDGLSVFTNVLLFVHVMIAYLINSTVLSHAVCRWMWPGLIERNGSQSALKWGVVASTIMITCIVIATLVPFFSDLMNIYSSVSAYMDGVFHRKCCDLVGCGYNADG